MPFDGFSDLATVQRWIHEIAEGSRSQGASTAHSVHHMKLRPKADKPAQARHPLIPTSGNQLRRKQAFAPPGQALNPDHHSKRRKTMDKAKQPEETGAVPEKRGRGRPKKTPKRQPSPAPTNTPSCNRQENRQSHGRHSPNRRRLERLANRSISSKLIRLSQFKIWASSCLQSNKWTCGLRF